MTATASRPPALDALVTRADDDGATTLTLADPARRNALSESMLTALGQALSLIGEDRSVRAVVLAANGPAFCAGHDLKEMQAHRGDRDEGREHYKRVFAACAAVMTAIVRSPQPVIAAVEGVATAAGCQLVASCDLVVAGAAARFATPGVNIGLFCSTPMVALSRAIGRKHAMEMLLTGDMIDAETAWRFGLVNRVVPAGQAHAGALGLARKIAEKPRKVVKLGKRAFYEQIEMPLDAAYAHTRAVMVENMLAADAREGVGAFLERRPARWEE